MRAGAMSGKWSSIVASASGFKAVVTSLQELLCHCFVLHQLDLSNTAALTISVHLFSAMGKKHGLLCSPVHQPELSTLRPSSRSMNRRQAELFVGSSPAGASQRSSCLTMAPPFSLWRRHLPGSSHGPSSHQPPHGGVASGRG